MTTLPTKMSFSEAFELCRRGTPIRLPHWNPDTRIQVKVPFADTDASHPYLYVESKLGIVPWQMTVPELFSYHWEVYSLDDSE